MTEPRGEPIAISKAYATKGAKFGPDVSVALSTRVAAVQSRPNISSNHGHHETGVGPVRATLPRSPRHLGLALPTHRHRRRLVECRPLQHRSSTAGQG